MGRFFSDLNLNASTPARVQPKVGSWGPSLVPSTRHKKVVRVVTWVVLVLVLAAVIGLGTFIYFQMKNAGAA